MLKNIRIEAKTELRGNYFKCIGSVAASFLSVVIFLLYCLSSVYLFIFDTSLLAGIGVFRNEITLAAACAACVLIGFTLLLVAVYAKFKKELRFFNLFENIEYKKFTVANALKLLSLYTLTFIKKLFYLFVFTLPSISVLPTIFVVLRQGVYTGVFAAVLAADYVLLICGVICGLIFIQRYSLVSYKFITSDEKSFKNIFKESIADMNDKCFNMFALKFVNFPKRLLCLTVLPAFRLLPYCIASEKCLLAEDFIEKEEKEKPVVFYLGRQAV